MRSVSSDGIHDGHAASTAIELEVQVELIDRCVVQEVEGNHHVVGTVHARNDLLCRIEDGPVEVGTRRDVGIDVKRCVRVVSQRLQRAGLVAQGRACPVRFRRCSDVHVVDKPVIATRAASAVLMNAELGVGVKGCGRQRGHELEV